MKNFDDFVKTITDEEYQAIISEARSTLKSIPQSDIASKSLAETFQISLSLLRHYHEWENS